MAANKRLLLGLGVLGAGVGVAALAGGTAQAKAPSPAPEPAEDDDEEPPRVPPGKAPPKPPVEIPDDDEIDMPSEDDLEEITDAARQDEADDDDEDLDEADDDEDLDEDDEDITQAEVDDLADVVDKPAPDEDEADDDDAPEKGAELTSSQKAYLGAIVASIRGSRTLAPPAQEQLEQMVREVLLGIDGGPRVLDELKKRDLAPTAATWCRLMGGAIKGMPRPLSVDSQRSRYPKAYAVVQAACEASPGAPKAAKPEPQPTPDKAPTPVESEPSTPEPEGPTPPAGYNPVAAKRLSKQVARNVDNRGCPGYSRQMMRQFQRAAGIAVDGLYGGGTRGALIHFGVRRPPEPCVATKGTGRATRPYPWAKEG